MVARTGRRVPVRVATVASASSRGELRLGRVPLKACLGAICVASPELVFERTSDYILYAVDPEESVRAAQRSPSARGLGTSGSVTPGRAAGDAGTSPTKLTSGRTAPILVGKGFFRWTLEEAGDGSTHVVGRVQSEPRTSHSAFSSDEEDAAPATAYTNEVLEVVLHMKDAPTRSREQYQNMMRGIRGDATREEERRTERAPAPAPAPRPAAEAPGSALPPGQTAQLLQVLQALQSHQSAQPQPPPEQQSQLISMLTMVAGALQGGSAGAGNSPAGSSPAVPPARATAASPAGSMPRRTGAPAPSEPRRVCYNCGTTTSRTWRILQLQQGHKVNFPASERPPSDVVPMTWVPKYRGLPRAEADGETRWQACNPCGLYFTKYGVSRPDHVWNFGGSRAANRATLARKRDESKDVLPPKRIKAEHAAPSPAVSSAPERRRAGAPSAPATSPPRPPATRWPPKATTPRSGAASQSSPGGSAASAYGVPSYLMDSSPGTVMHRLMSEADLDFEEMNSSGVCSTPGDLLRSANRARPVSPGSLRRSPRKRPHGTRCQVNPYASSKSPAQRSAPGSPTPLRRTTSSPSAARNAGAPATAASTPRRTRTPSHSSPGVLTRSRSRREAAEPTPLTRLASMGPFMGMSAEEDDALGGPPSPSLERSAQRAQRRRDASPSRGRLSPPSGQLSPPALGLGENSLSLGLEAPAATPWNKSPGMKELFGDASWLAEGWSKPGSDGKPGTGAARAEPPARAPSDEKQVVRRQPQPATVEDASSSCSSSPEDTGGDDLVDLLEDPYGLLAASGFGVLNQSGDGSNGPLVVPGNGQGAPGISVDAFNGIELHQAPDFAAQLEAFTREGGLGVAAHIQQPQNAVAPAPGAAAPVAVRGTRSKTEEKPAQGGDLDRFLDDPSVQAMLAELDTGGAERTPAESAKDHATPTSHAALPAPAPVALPR